jgi:bacteriocin-like protein
MKTKPPARKAPRRFTELSKDQLAKVTGGAGFLDSGPSDAHVIERHELPGNQGGFWP